MEFFKKELAYYFTTPVGYVFIAVFLLANTGFTVYYEQFFTRGQADLVPLFNIHPWLYMIFMPVLSMRIWAEERKSGMLELLFTMPITVKQLILSKFFAAWIFSAITLLLTFPLWILVNYLGQPDNLTIISSYIGSFLLAGGFLAIGCCMSALTKNQTLALILSLLVGCIFNVLGFTAIREFSFLAHFSDISKGVINVSSIVYLTSVIIFWLVMNFIVIEAKRAK